MKLTTAHYAIGAAIVAAIVLLSSGVNEKDVDSAFQYAMSKEKDPQKLRDFARAMRAAGRFGEADALQARADGMSGAQTAPMAQAAAARAAPVAAAPAAAATYRGF